MLHLIIQAILSKIFFLSSIFAERNKHLWYNKQDLGNSFYIFSLVPKRIFFTMAFKQIKIERFRNFSCLSFCPGIHVNLIIGDNGSGKSSLLEAIGYLSQGKSFRTSHWQNLVQRGSSDFVIFGDKGDNKIGIRRSLTGDFDIRINGVNTSRLSELVYMTSMQIIHPADLDLILGGPSLRRAYVDWGSFYQSQDFFGSWSNFKRILKQRNSYLKNYSDYRLLRVLDHEMVDRAVKLNYLRTSYFEKVTPYIHQVLKRFLPEYDFELNFYPGWDLKKQLENVLVDSFDRDRMSGYTVYGPQRADLRILVDGKNACEVLSRGQIKLLLCALKIAQGTYLEDQCNKQCLFLFDDFSSELDSEKKSILSSYFDGMKGQIFITAIDEKDKTFFEQSNFQIFELKNNVIEQR